MSKKIIPELTTEYIHSLFEYKNDCLFWKPKKVFNKYHKIWNSRYAFNRAGTKIKTGYISIGIIINGITYRYLAHRLIFTINHGYTPNQVDHINGCTSDSRIENLRDVTNSINGKNCKINSNNTSGLLGVTWDKSRGKWHAQIMVNFKNNNLGRYIDFFEACCARKSAERKYGFHINHGRD